MSECRGPRAALNGVRHVKRKKKNETNVREQIFKKRNGPETTHTYAHSLTHTHTQTHVETRDLGLDQSGSALPDCHQPPTATSAAGRRRVSRTKIDETLAKSSAKDGYSTFRPIWIDIWTHFAKNVSLEEKSSKSFETEHGWRLHIHHLKCFHGMLK